MTSFFLTNKIVRSKRQQWNVFRIKFQHLRGVTPFDWKNIKHIRKIPVSILLIHR
ncbi:Uncharacterised protein [Vibrio cholerae]|uniref:Uncharacterized protein n=1 Tax=Vibrio cholerae TaxID=666 RepID=A0A655ZMV4_VIBCL|nr:hypothetical protein DN32_2983 [Vibrio cholerae]KFE01162.1 hypothetical protein DN43_3261 [Vibrio cholerae]KFE18440.1 hypothetical protein DN39_3267 [Vibrio cholerae]CRZ51598.1 Uncharacterised protein [Vibrio cholerae]CSA58259.1 Uncharacterised protein [Vibrio cholerae]